MLKSSHFTVPRTLGECHFAANADPIERPEHRRMDWQDRVCIWAGAIALAAMLFIVG